MDLYTVYDSRVNLIQCVRELSWVCIFRSVTSGKFKRNSRFQFSSFGSFPRSVLYVFHFALWKNSPQIFWHRRKLKTWAILGQCHIFISDCNYAPAENGRLPAHIVGEAKANAIRRDYGFSSVALYKLTDF